MMKRTVKMISLLAVLILLLFSVGCTAKSSLTATYTLNYVGLHTAHEEPTVFTADNTTPYEDLITKTVDIHAFAQEFDPYGGKCIHCVQEKFGVECLRETEAGALYSVHKVEQGGLLYVFYDNYEWQRDTEITKRGIMRWFYERERLSFEDIAAAMKPSTPLTDALNVLETDQIMLNIYEADRDNPLYDHGIQTQHYLEDGILEVGYTREDEQFVLCLYTLYEDFTLYDMGEGRREDVDARILEMDWVE